MDLKPDQEKVKVLLIDTISLLCRSGLSFNRNIVIQGVIGITVDRSEVFLVHINQELSPSDDIECIDISSRSTNKIDATQQHKPYENKLKIKLSNTRSDSNKESNFYISNQDAEDSSHPRRPLTYQPSYDSPAVSVGNANTGRNDEDNRSAMFSPSQRIKKEPGYTSTPYQGSQGSEINEPQSIFCPQNSSMNESMMQQASFKYDNISFSGDFNPMRGVGSNRRASRRRGGRRGGTVGTRPIKMGVNDGNTSWDAMVTTSFMCKVCGQSFVHKSNLLGHQIRIHGRQKNKRGRPPSNNNHSIAASQVVTTTNTYSENNASFNEFSSQNVTMFDLSGFDGGYPQNSTSNPQHYSASRQVSLRGDSDEESSDQPVEEVPTSVNRPSGQDFDYSSDFHHNGMTNQNYPTTPQW